MLALISEIHMGESGVMESATIERIQEAPAHATVATLDAPNKDLNTNITTLALNEKRTYLLLKRAFDIVASLGAGVLLLIPMAAIALLIRLDSPGPALFRQERLGEGGKPFIILKFRSMRMNAEENGPQWADKNDSRCTRIGRMLRQTRLDELPQLWNILRGEMSIVGPRPERACFYEVFETYIPGFCDRMEVKPGLTGLAQVNGGYDLKPEEKIVYDMEYIRNRSLRMDIICILKTVKLVFTHKGAR